MGWQSEVAPEHEGYAIGVVEVERSGFWHTLTFASDGNRGDVPLVPLVRYQVECECGWRSPRQLAPLGTVWFPSTVAFPAGSVEDDRAHDLWREHIAHIAGRQ